MQDVTKSATRVRVLLVDNNIEFLELAGQHLAADPAIEVVGWALTGLELTRRLKALFTERCIGRRRIGLYDQAVQRRDAGLRAAQPAG